VLYVSRVRNRAQALKLRTYVPTRDARVAVMLARELVAHARALTSRSAERSTASSSRDVDASPEPVHEAHP
jgi:hypothetical protein